MKNINKILGVLTSVVLISCSGDAVEDKPVIAKGTSPVLLTPQSDFNIILSKANELNIATTVIWNDASYQGMETVANYSIQIAKSGTNFANPIEAATTTSRFKSLTVAELNSALVNGGFEEKVSNDVDIRIKSVVGSSGLPQYSNFYTIKATPYHTPLATSLWLVGAATPGGWSWDGDAETEFPLVKGESEVYSVSINLIQDNTFRVFLGNNFTSNDNWAASNNFAFYLAEGYTIDSEFENANDGDQNFKYTGPTGVRVFTINKSKKTITLE